MNAHFKNFAGAPDEDIAANFLEKLRPDGPWVLTAIAPDKKGDIETITAQTACEVEDFVSANNGKRNLYYGVNPTRMAMAKKAAKTDIAAIEYVLADLDPAEGETAADAKARYLGQLKTFKPLPTVILDSGNGIQVLWRLKHPIIPGNPIRETNENEPQLVFSPEDQAKIDDVEARVAAVMVRLGAEAGTQNIDRILRLPGTANLPNAKKKREGRVPCLATLIEFNENLAYPLEAFPPASGKKGPGRSESSRDRGPDIDFDDLPAVDIAALPISDKIKEAIGTDGSELGDGDRSRAVFHVACELVRAGCSDQQIASVLWFEPIGAHCHEQEDPKRAVCRAIGRARQKATKPDAASEFDSTEFVLDRGLPSKTSQHNIRLALRRLGVTVRHDIFQDRLIIQGLAGCGPLLDDRAMERLWLTIDERYRFRPVKDFFWTVVGDEARRYAYHPVRDYLASVQWDGVPRIDKWLTTYANAESTPYTDAVGALVLVAAVRRVRQPGCKFDEMPVLEGAQGTNKSTALRILAANDDWFSDDVPLNADEKRVIEVLSGRWIVEAAELNGMRQSDVEHLKAFLSRTHDRARMSYDRLVTEVARQCVIVGTTNSERYLRDSTGNRRYWPITIERFDLDALRRDRDQLWAEAAVREAQGMSIRLDRALWAAAADEQTERRIADPWEEMAAEYLDGLEGKLKAEDAWKLVGVPEGQRTQAHNQRLGMAMQKAGWNRTRRRDRGERQYTYAKGKSEQWIHVTRDPRGCVCTIDFGADQTAADLAAAEELLS